MTKREMHGWPGICLTECPLLRVRVSVAIIDWCQDPARKQEDWSHHHQPEPEEQMLLWAAPGV